MPIATPEVYAEMLDKAKQNRFAYPAINVSSSQTLIAAIRGFAEAGSDGYVQSCPLAVMLSAGRESSIWRCRKDSSAATVASNASEYVA